MHRCAAFLLLNTVVLAASRWDAEKALLLVLRRRRAASPRLAVWRFGRDSCGVGDFDNEVVAASFSASSASFGALRSLSCSIFDAEADGRACVAPGGREKVVLSSAGG